MLVHGLINFSPMDVYLISLLVSTNRSGHTLQIYDLIFTQSYLSSWVDVHDLLGFMLVVQKWQLIALVFPQALLFQTDHDPPTRHATRTPKQRETTRLAWRLQRRFVGHSFLAKWSKLCSKNNPTDVCHCEFYFIYSRLVSCYVQFEPPKTSAHWIEKHSVRILRIRDIIISRMSGLIFLHWQWAYVCC